MKTILKNGYCVISDDKNQTSISPLDISIENGRILEISQNLESPNAKIIDCKNLMILPGLIDTQVHFREPGLTHKEDLHHGSLGAIFGGITAFFEMPNTKPNTITPADIQNKVSIAEKNSFCDFGFFLGACAENRSLIAEYENTPGCCGVKIFMGSSTGSLLVDNDEDLEAVLKSGVRRVSVHCEDEKRLIERKSTLNSNPNVSLHPLWRDEETALIATQRIVTLAKRHKRKIHVLHLTTKQEVLWLKDNKHHNEIEDLITCEVTPQHLTLAAPDCYDQLGTLAQMNPPIRNQDHQDELWKAVHNKTIDVVGSDHAPHTLQEKSNPYPSSPSGMTGVQTTVPLLLDHVHNKRLTLERLVDLMAHRPAKIFNMKDRGHIQKGFLANFTVVDLKKEMTITNEWIKSKSQWTPFHNKKVIGCPIHTIINGEPVVSYNQLVSPEFRGRAVEFN
ncbi:MAG: dihydroorotase [Bdellovibrionales bacterium]|nr:dihydroorotase [Bdellovibrionales bacterium]